MADETGETRPSIPEPETHEVIVTDETLQRLSEFSQKVLSTQVSLDKALTSGDNFHLATDRLEDLRDTYRRLHSTTKYMVDELRAGRAVRVVSFGDGGVLITINHDRDIITAEQYRQLMEDVFPQDKSNLDKYSGTSSNVMWNFITQRRAGVAILKPSQ